MLLHEPGEPGGEARRSGPVRGLCPDGAAAQGERSRLAEGEDGMQRRERLDGGGRDERAEDVLRVRPFSQTPEVRGREPNRPPAAARATLKGGAIRLISSVSSRAASRAVSVSVQDTSRACVSISSARSPRAWKWPLTRWRREAALPTYSTAPPARSSR